MKEWIVSALDKEKASRIAERWGLPFFLAMLLEIRGITEPKEIESFLSDEAHLSDPMAFADMEKAVARVRKAIDSFEKICVYGDYDADGVTATALLYSYLESAVANVMYYIPQREGEGYGLNCDAIHLLHQQGVTLIITVDNGISSVDEVAYAASLGIDVVITDHHQPPPLLPDAVAVVDPHREDCPSTFKDYAGVGVAYLLAAALEEDAQGAAAVLENEADLLAIGTIGDIVPLHGENRALVRMGLKQLSNTERLGVRELLAHAGMEGKTLTSTNVAFTLAPRINATGRMGSSDRAVRLLLAEYPEEAKDLAGEICNDNVTRQTIEQDIMRQVQDLLQQEPQRLYDRVLVVEGQGWHHGVIGIVASRLVEKYGRPCIVIGIEGQEARGSGRSVQGFSLYDAVASCKELLTRFGGHPMAAGVSLDPNKVGHFRTAINRYAATAQKEMPFLQLKIDCRLNPAALSVELVNQMEAMEPFGSGNPAPLFGLFGVSLHAVHPVGGGKHLRLSFTKKGTEFSAMRFGTTPEQFPYQPGDVLDLAVALDKSSYRGQESVTIIIREMRLTETKQEDCLQQSRWFEAVMRGEEITPEAARALLPNREECAAVYRYLRASGGWRVGLNVLLYRLGVRSIGYGKLAVILHMMEQSGLVLIQIDGDAWQIELQQTTGKVHLEEAAVYRRLREQAENQRGKGEAFS